MVLSRTAHGLLEFLVDLDLLEFVLLITHQFLNAALVEVLRFIKLNLFVIPDGFHSLSLDVCSTILLVLPIWILFFVTIRVLPQYKTFNWCCVFANILHTDSLLTLQLLVEVNDLLVNSTHFEYSASLGNLRIIDG